VLTAQNSVSPKAVARHAGDGAQRLFADAAGHDFRADLDQIRQLLHGREIIHLRRLIFEKPQNRFSPETLNPQTRNSG
jgi:hypothetical protein